MFRIREFLPEMNSSIVCEGETGERYHGLHYFFGRSDLKTIAYWDAVLIFLFKPEFGIAASR